MRPKVDLHDEWVGISLLRHSSYRLWLYGTDFAQNYAVHVHTCL